MNVVNCIVRPLKSFGAFGCGLSLCVPKFLIVFLIIFLQFIFFKTYAEKLFVSSLFFSWVLLSVLTC